MASPLQRVSDTDPTDVGESPYCFPICVNRFLSSSPTRHVGIRADSTESTAVQIHQTAGAAPPILLTRPFGLSQTLEPDDCTQIDSEAFHIDLTGVYAVIDVGFQQYVAGFSHE